jgi:hypothetical protein
MTTKRIENTKDMTSVFSTRVTTTESARVVFTNILFLATK